MSLFIAIPREPGFCGALRAFRGVRLLPTDPAKGQP